MSEWQPIETAPRDAPVVLANPRWPWPLVGVWKDDAWVDVVDSVSIERPTHWLPIPPPPQSVPAEGRRDRGVTAVTARSPDGAET